MRIYVVTDYDDITYVGIDEKRAKEIGCGNYYQIWEDGYNIGTVIWNHGKLEWIYHMLKGFSNV